MRFGKHGVLVGLLLFIVGVVSSYAASTPQHTHAAAPKPKPPTRTPTPVPVVTQLPTATLTPVPVATQSPTATPTAVPVATATNCSTYTPARWFFDSQAWWKDANEEYFAQEHLHLGTCFPHGQTVSGTVPLVLVIRLHNNPGLVTWVRVQIYLPSSDPQYSVIQNGCHGDGIECYDFNPPYQCPPTQMDCAFTITLPVDTTEFPYDGLQEFRISTNIQKGNSQRLYQTNGWRATLANKHPVKHVAFDSGMVSVEGRGWHTGANYTNARLNSFPQEPVRGIWSFGVRLDKGADGATVTEHEILIDPDIHAGSKGVSVPITVGGRAETTPYLWSAPNGGSGHFTGAVSIDTTKLANGPHKLLLRSGATIPAPPGTNSGVIVVPFVVDN